VALPHKSTRFITQCISWIFMPRQPFVNGKIHMHILIYQNKTSYFSSNFCDSPTQTFDYGSPFNQSCMTRLKNNINIFLEFKSQHGSGPNCIAKDQDLPFTVLIDHAHQHKKPTKTLSYYILRAVGTQTILLMPYPKLHHALQLEW
jgi:hypothetical protein